tara:strand:+ start:434 stop:1138 length:705 start_codon:yes stop_codon:yes gene_type:complete
MSENLQKNRKLVEQVFNKVYDKYDLMNDIMSLGSHRIWKKNLITMMNPTKGRTLIDVGCGTGDIGELFSKATLNQSEILSVDPNSKMIAKAKIKHKKYENIKWKVCKGESLDVKTESFDFYTISFGLRNTGDIKKTISEAYRVLKKGGRFFCLEFSKIDNENLNFLYQQYSKFIPKIGKYIVGDSQPYEYLVKTINEFLNQEELLELIKDQKFENCSYRNLSGGIVSIHSGWKI